MLHHNSQQQGFTLLMTLIVVSVVVSVGLTILDLSIKQLNLSTSSKDSEIAFHAANAGIECAQHNRDVNEAELFAGNDDIVYNCFGDTFTDDPDDSITFSDTPSDSGNDVYKYEHNFTWGETGAERCTEITTLVINAVTQVTVSTSTLKSAILGYPDKSRVCEPGALCTIMSVRGYSKSCSTKDSHGAIQREVLLEY